MKTPRKKLRDKDSGKIYVIKRISSSYIFLASIDGTSMIVLPIQNIRAASFLEEIKA